MPGNALAGSVNMVPRSAFERTKPQLTTNAYILMRDDVRTLDFDTELQAVIAGEA